MHKWSRESERGSSRRLNASLEECLSIHSSRNQGNKVPGLWAFHTCCKGKGLCFLLQVMIWILEASLGSTVWTFYFWRKNKRGLAPVKKVSDRIHISLLPHLPYLWNTTGSWKKYLDRTVIVKPGKERGRIPVRVRSFPVSIWPNQIWFIPDREMNITSEWLICSYPKGSVSQHGVSCLWSLLSLPIVWHYQEVNAIASCFRNSFKWSSCSSKERWSQLKVQDAVLLKQEECISRQLWGTFSTWYNGYCEQQVSKPGILISMGK